MKLKKICIGACIFYMLSSGCATTRYHRPSKIEPVIKKGIATSDIKPIFSILDSDNKSIDDLISASEEYIEYLTFRKKYSDYQNQVIANLKESDFKVANNLVKELAAALERDPDPYAKKFLVNVKEFEYYRIDYIDYTNKRNLTLWNAVKGIYISPFTTSIGVILLPLSPTDAKDMLTLPLDVARPVTEVKLERPYIRKVLVKPYYGTEKVVEDNIPIPKESKK